MQQVAQFTHTQKISVILFTFSYYTVNVRSTFKNIFLHSNSAGKKSHTYEEGGTPQNFYLALINELEKQISI